MAHDVSAVGGTGSDPGMEAIGRLHLKMMIDEVWTVRRSRGFTWWGYRLAQHVDAGVPKLAPDGARGCTVTVRTDVVSGIPPSKSEAAQSVVNLANMMQSMNALVYDEAAGTIHECASVTFHDDTLDVWLDVLALASVLQNSAAHSRAHALASALDGKPAATPHPVRGMRPQMDDLLNGPASWAADAGQQASRFAGSPMLALEKYAIQWAACSADATGFTGEVPYSGSRSAVELMLAGHKGARETSLVQMFADQPHPQLGSGLLMRMRPPVESDEADCLAAAMRLNAIEASGLAPCKLLGAWCEADGELNYVAFLPSMLARPGLLENLFVDCAVRSKWAVEHIGI